jgi:hypothetical protein
MFGQRGGGDQALGGELSSEFQPLITFWQWTPERFPLTLRYTNGHTTLVCAI